MKQIEINLFPRYFQHSLHLNSELLYKTSERMWKLIFSPFLRYKKMFKIPTYNFSPFYDNLLMCKVFSENFNAF